MIFEGYWRVRIFRAVCKLSLQDTQTRSKKKPVLVVSLSLVHPSRLCEPLTSRVLTLEKSCSVAGLFCELPGDDDEMMMVLFYANANQRTRAREFEWERVTNPAGVLGGHEEVDVDRGSGGSGATVIDPRRAHTHRYATQ